jgi:hypothetical protein
VLVWFPAGDAARIALSGKGTWFDTRTGESQPATPDGDLWIPPDTRCADGHPHDYLLILAP